MPNNSSVYLEASANKQAAEEQSALMVKMFK